MAEFGFLRAVPGGVRVAVRAQPGARKTALQGVFGEAAEMQLKVAVQAPPVEGKANAALTEFLAKFFAVPRSRVLLTQGELKRSKVFEIREIDPAEAAARIAKALGG